MKIYEKQNFNELPDYVWDSWLKKVKKEIISSSYPLLLIRVGISDKSQESEMHWKMFDIGELKKDATFGDYFYYQDKYIRIAFNTMIDYVGMTVDDYLNEIDK